MCVRALCTYVCACVVYLCACVCARARTCSCAHVRVHACACEGIEGALPLGVLPAPLLMLKPSYEALFLFFAAASHSACAALPLHVLRAFPASLCCLLLTCCTKSEPPVCPLWGLEGRRMLSRPFTVHAKFDYMTPMRALRGPCNFVIKCS
jgi:hypothetical protein